MSDLCHGNGEDHCCWVNGEVCPFLEENTIPGRRWVCGLRRELGSWEAVHNSPGYLEKVKPVWLQFGVQDCGDFKGAFDEEGNLCKQCCFKDEDGASEQ